jgi:diacylglycerol kinase (ATP)
VRAPHHHHQRPFRATGLVASFGHALRGVVEVAARERNMKLHVLAGLGVGLLGSEVALPLGARLALVVCVALVLAGEMLNSALESLVDLHTRELREEARRVKDAAAGTVLVFAAGAALVGLVVVVASWETVVEARPRILGDVLPDLALLAIAAGLLFGRWGRGVVAGAAIAGLGSLAWVGLSTVSWAFLGLAGVLFGVCVAVGVAAPHPGPLPAAAGRGGTKP